MNKSNKYSRRSFTKLTTMGIVGIPLLSFQNKNIDNSSDFSNELDVHLFSKHLQFLDYNDMSAAAAEMGFQGLDIREVTYGVIFFLSML